LPFSKDLVDSKPALRGSNIPAIQLWQKPCWANLFDGQVAAGPIPILLSQFAEDPDLIQVTIVPAPFSPFSPFSQNFTIAQMGYPKGTREFSESISVTPFCYYAP
jgi:hypothetical protein